MYRKFNVSINSARKVFLRVFTHMFKAVVNINSVCFV